MQRFTKIISRISWGPIIRIKMKLCFAVLLICIPIVATVRFKRAACDSTFGDWSEWTSCDSDCGFCGTQTRTRTCAPVSGCTDVTCSGDATESQACSTTNDICLAPSPSCCPHTYKKKADIAERRFYCELE
ncbi:hypothetical protein CRE_16712 [Caenorhabditis remanei]|uniref:Uncharacterized protein n=1 Tax=Caenorhabditis remanei TaxID=31234 RepID=E3MAL8_CAERE|nr:hypothetical protein CRE_16712 [Caenorhabditis remanei]